MKHLIEKPYEPVMRFFTPELYARFNSSDDGEADRADEDWEEAIRADRRHLDGIRDKFSSKVKELTKLNLHDAELLAFDQTSDPSLFDRFGPFPFHIGVGIMSLRQDDGIVSLFYLLRDRITRYKSKESWTFSTEKPHWLYDELDVEPEPFLFIHRVLLSDGVVFKIPFLSVHAHRVPLKASGNGRGSKQIA